MSGRLAGWSSLFVTALDQLRTFTGEVDEGVVQTTKARARVHRHVRDLELPQHLHDKVRTILGDADSFTPAVCVHHHGFFCLPHLCVLTVGTAQA